MLKGKTIIIVGGTGLIGRHLSIACAEQGAKVIVAARTPRMNVFENCRPDLRRRLSFTAVDATRPESVESLFDKPFKGSDRIDGVVNCSFPRGAGYGVCFEDVSYENFCNNVNMHLGSAFLVCQKAAAYFTQAGGGTIVNVSSIYGLIAPRFEIYDGTQMTKEVEYIVSKSAIVQLTKYLAKYLKGRNIRVNCVSPGGVYNEEPNHFVARYNDHCLNKGMLTGEDVAGTVLYLLSDQSLYVNGQNIVVDDGFSL